MKYLMTALALAALSVASAPVCAASVQGSAADITTAGSTALITVNIALTDVDALTLFAFSADWLTGPSFVVGSGTVFGESAESFKNRFADLAEITEISTNAFSVQTFTTGTAFSLPVSPSTVTFQVSGLTPGDHVIRYQLAVMDGAGNYLAATDFSSTVSAVPEANPAMMLAAGLAVMGLLARRRRA